MKNKENLKKPFFANFLENQMSNDEQAALQGGITTVLIDNAHTMKYPSDKEDSAESITKPSIDIAHTMKYPSDNDEASDM